MRVIVSREYFNLGIRTWWRLNSAASRGNGDVAILHLQSWATSTRCWTLAWLLPSSVSLTPRVLHASVGGVLRPAHVCFLSVMWLEFALLLHIAICFAPT